ncbi:mitochondrial carrier [Piedraia hortae CBS 480.64]|uniref:Mitochondrial carrier n=1 Tax=Piedraia hortae CBS 480.64 TaxID=1314780 RepID=A0A6A7C3K6_9PEZI|nr:mitochondrial carrier [Piedraia hortae CBS 480.64]
MDTTDEDLAEYNIRLDAFELYHLIHEHSESTRSRFAGGPALPALGHALAGSLATATSKALLYPLDLVTTRLQVCRRSSGSGKEGYSSLVDALQKIYHEEGGLSAFYIGCVADVSKGIADSFLFFLAYTFLRQRQLAASGKKNLSAVRELSIGVVAGSFAKLFTTPLQNLVTRQQTAAGKDKGKTLTEIAQQIYSQSGWSGFWAGYSASLILTMNPAITFMVDAVLKRVVARSSKLSSRLTFLVAAISKAVATTATYPIILAKSRAQSSNKPKSTRAGLRQLLGAQYAIFLSLRAVYKAEGLSGLYSGLETEVLKGFLSHGMTMTIKDRAHVGVIESYYFLLKLLRRWPDDLNIGSSGPAGAVKA